MSIETEITRLENAKSNLKTAITNKGVTVADAAAIADFAGHINNIQLGTRTARGTFTCNEDTKSVTLEIGFVPNFLFIWCEDIKNSKILSNIFTVKTADIDQCAGTTCMVFRGGEMSFVGINNENITITSTPTHTTITISSSVVFKNAVGFAWLASL